MKNLFFVFAVALFGSFLFTSCQKDNLSQGELDIPQQEVLNTSQATDYTIDRAAHVESHDEDDRYAISIGISPEIYYLLKSNEKAVEILSLIEDSDIEEKPLKIAHTNEGEIIQIQSVTEEEFSNWKNESNSLIVDESGPDMASARGYSIRFSNYNHVYSANRYLSNQECNDNYTPEVYPCIPFKYKRDGCYARAHKMKETLEWQYGKTCKKIFAWGKLYSGCSRSWYYHVAPIVYDGRQWLVLDPSLSDNGHPLTIEAWKRKMVPNSRYNAVTEIKPGNYYLPRNQKNRTAGYYVGSYTTHMNNTLIRYKNRKNCSWW